MGVRGGCCWLLGSVKLFPLFCVVWVFLAELFSGGKGELDVGLTRTMEYGIFGIAFPPRVALSGCGRFKGDCYCFHRKMRKDGVCLKIKL